MSIHQLNFDGVTLLEMSIKRLQEFEPKEGYYLAFSGGKDSVVIKALADMAGVKYDAHYSLTTVDPPELVQFIKEHHSDVEIDVPRDADGNRVTMWNLIPRKVMPPTRLVRYCCAELKERGGDGRLCVTGVRWAESANRKNNQGVVTIYGGKDMKELRENDSFMSTSKGGVVLTNDNVPDREWLEWCYQRNKTVINPIIDWTDDEVWEFIKEFNIPYCKLYDQGHKRLGCIACPMSGGSRMKKELERYPKYKNAYLRAFEKMIKVRKERGLDVVWQTGEDVMKWWIGEE